MELIEAIIKIANSDKLIKELEPNLFSHQKIQEWMVKRVLRAYLLFDEKWRKSEE